VFGLAARGEDKNSSAVPAKVTVPPLTGVTVPAAGFARGPVTTMDTGCPGCSTGH
jgi:hypothetical protein